MTDAIDWGADIAAYNAWFAEQGGWDRADLVAGGDYRGDKKAMGLGVEHFLRRGEGPGQVVPGWDGWNYGGMDPGLFPLADRR